MLVPRSVALLVTLACAVAGGCKALPDRDHLDRSGHYHEEIVDEGSYAVYQHYGASWKKVGFVWVAPGAERSVWVMRRPATGGYPYRPPSPNAPETWTRFRRIGREYASIEELVANERIDVARYYAVESQHSPVELPVIEIEAEASAGTLGSAATAEPTIDALEVATNERDLELGDTASGAVGLEGAGLSDGDYRLLRAGEAVGFAWVCGAAEVYLVEDGAVRAIEACAAGDAAEPLCLTTVRIGAASPTWRALAERQGLALADYAVLACDCRGHRPTAGLR